MTVLLISQLLNNLMNHFYDYRQPMLNILFIPHFTKLDF